ncbi:MAG: diguanylate cyclase, partial [Anaerolineaceae bacterium]
LFTMMFFQDSVFYLPVQDGVLQTDAHTLPEEEVLSLQEWLADSVEAYMNTSSGTGFFLRIQHLGEPLGLLIAENLTRPEHMEQYLNLSTMISGVCGLSIANARNYEKLLQAEGEARKEREISDTLRETMLELSSQLGLHELLGRILVSLHRVIPYSEALVFLRRGTMLEFSAGMRVTGDGEFNPHTPAAHLLKIDAPWLKSTPLTSRDLDRNPELLPYINPAFVRSWIGVPLMKQGEIIGYLSIGSRQSDLDDEDSIKMAQAFGAEVSIALENARLFSDLTEAAITDGLTGLFNRRHFFALAGVEFNRATRYQHPLSVILMDIDFFKRVNDQYGHQVGDQILKWFAALCKENKRESDILARYGGEEFVMLLPEADTARACAFAERLRQKVAETP